VYIFFIAASHWTRIDYVTSFVKHTGHWFFPNIMSTLVLQ